MDVKKKNRIEGVIAILIFIFLVIALYIVGNFYTDKREVYLPKLANLGFRSIPMCDDIKIISTSGGFPADGQTYIIYYFNEESAKYIIEHIKSSTVWKPLSEGDYFLTEDEMKSVKNGFGYFENLDHDREVFDRYNPVENKRLGGFLPTEYEIGVFDTDNYIMYYYRWEV